jgi:hypothetical protein
MKTVCLFLFGLAGGGFCYNFQAHKFDFKTFGDKGGGSGA